MLTVLKVFNVPNVPNGFEYAGNTYRVAKVIPVLLYRMHGNPYE